MSLSHLAQITQLFRSGLEPQFSLGSQSLVAPGPDSISAFWLILWFLAHTVLHFNLAVALRG